MAAGQTLLLGRHAERVTSTVSELTAQRWIARLWDNDASLWSRDPTTQESIRNRLGWLTIPRIMRREAATLRAFAHEVRGRGITRALLLGMGGSGLFSEVCRHTFGVAPDGSDLAVLDTTDPTAIRAQQDRTPLQQLLVIISSKSGSTSEITALSAYFYETFKRAGVAADEHAITITDAGTPLERQANAWGLRRIFTHGPTTGSDVGGRFSALTYFGLVSASLLGVDVDRLLDRAIEQLDRSRPDVPLEENPSVMLGAVLGALANAGMDKLTILCPPALASFGTWVEQLVAESTGKSGKGIVPIDGEPPREPSAYSDDRLFLELQLVSQVDPGVDRQARALAAAGRPVVRIHWQDRDDLGGEVIRWSIATTVAGSVMGVNPFDEPNVQESKDRTTALLTQYARDRRFPETEPLYRDGGLACYGTTAADAVPSISQALAELFGGARPNDYLAVLSFLPRTASLDRAAHDARRAIAVGLDAATMIGFGPRYLHSTGQLYKGGSDRGVFLQLTAEEPSDLAIPGQPWTFGVLKQAQALGDFQAMQSRGRRILRIHLSGDLDREARRLLHAIDDATASLARR